MIHAAQPLRADTSIDTMRALACLALVSFHVVGNTAGSGMELPLDHRLTLLNATFADMRMPLFSFLSGLVFVALERTRRTPQDLLGSKARRLLIPMLSVGALFWVARDLAGQAQQPIETLLVRPFAHFWFLQATFLIMLALVGLTWISGRRDVLVAAVLLALGAVIWVTRTLPPDNIFSVIQAFHLMPFFMAGYLCRRVGIPRIRARWGALIVLAIVALGGLLATETWIVPETVRRGLSVGCGLVFCLTLLSLRPQSRVLARLGAMSYAIFLFHVFFTATSRATWLVVWPDMPDVLMWASGIAAGLLGPMVLSRAIASSPLLAFVFLGVRPALHGSAAVSRPLHVAQMDRL